MTPPLDPDLDPGRDASRDALRRLASARLDELRSECEALGACLGRDTGIGPGGTWRGAASAMYRIRLAKLRERLPALRAAISSAERALGVP